MKNFLNGSRTLHVRRNVVLISCLLCALISLVPVNGRTETGDEDSASSATGANCLGSPTRRWVLRQHLLAQYNMNGLEHHARTGLCFPLVTDGGPLFDLSRLEVGVGNTLSPSYERPGGYLEIVPLSVLVLRAEVAGVVFFPTLFDRTGYFERSGYEDTFREEDLPAELGTTRGGWFLGFMATLRARIPLGALGLVGTSIFNFERWLVGSQHFLVTRRDLIALPTDWLLANEALLMLEVPLTEGFLLRFGGFDSLRFVPNSDYLGNQVGGIVMGVFPHPTASLRDLQVFLRAGVYTHHAFRTGTLGLLAGVTLGHDLMEW